MTERLARGECIHSDPVAGDDFLWGGIHLNLYKDQVESYYHNLMAPQAMLYVIVRVQDNILTPVLVSASFDEANAYIESSDDAHPVPMPAEVYPWVERFVLEHYQPEPPRKRKRKNWK